ncbi:ABC transporter ATP-binding protein [Candidatus Poriferisocius sp.]|uniref:ABC transporter ATP-binding protein n=1 Tax=Candidatus Poriferisocius sp. TaxID=3101276 RepID=UPI003B02DB12
MKSTSSTWMIDKSVAVRRSLLWILLARQKGIVRWLVGAMGGSIVVNLLIASATVALVDNGIVDQAIPLQEYVSYIFRLALLGFAFGFAFKQLTERLGYQLEFDLRTWLYTRVQWADLRTLDKVTGGQLVTRSMTDLNLVQGTLQLLPTIVTLAPATIALLVYLAFLSPALALITFLSIPLNFWLLSLFRKRLWGLSWAELNERAEVAAAIDEPVRGVRVMRAFGRENEERQRLSDVALRTYRYSMTRVRLLARYDIFLKAVPLLVNAAVLVVGARLVVSGNLSVGTFLVAFQTAGIVTTLAQLLDELASRWQYLRSAQLRLTEVLALGERPTEGRPLAETFEGFELQDVEVDFEGHIVIDNVSASVRPGDLVVVTGPPGSGKSTLANLMGGLLSPTSGEIFVDGRPLSELDITTIRRVVRVVSEEPVLFSGTLRDNLDLGAPWEVSDHEITVALDAAGADDITERLANGLDGTIGDRGLTLSGGQRQRLALARAIIARPRVIVLDDALSGVSPAHELRILKQMAEVLPDTIVVAISRRPDPVELADIVIELPDRPGTTTSAGAADPFALDDADVDGSLANVVHSLDVSNEEPLVDDETSRVDKLPRARFLARVTAAALVVLLVLLVVNTLAKIGPELLFSQAADAAEDRDSSIVYVIGAAAVGVGIVFALSGYFLRIIAMKIAQSIVYLMRRRVFQRLTKLGIDFYDRELPGEVAARVVNDLDTVLNFLQEPIFRFISTIASLVIGLTVAVILVPQIAPVVVVMAVLMLAATYAQLVVGHRAFERARTDLGRTISVFEEHFAGRSELRGCGAQEKANRRFVGDAWELRQSRRWATSAANLYAETMQFIALVGGAFVLARAGNAAIAGTVAVGTALAARLVVDQALRPLAIVGGLYSYFLDSRVSWRRLGHPFKAPIWPIERPDAEEVGPLTGDLAFESVSFTYPQTDQPVLRDTSFALRAGSVTAIVGFTGAGKSSITKLLTRIYDPDSGRITHDGIDIRDYRAQSLRHRLGIVPQDAFLFKGTIRTNIAYGRPEASDDELMAAARAIGADSLISELEDGLDHPVDEEGRNLTAAQRQLVALARAWLAQPDVLVLDEATSSLGGPLEQAVLDAVRSLGATTLIVTHRQNVALQADFAVVVEDGRVVENGPPSQLAGAGTAFDRLWYAVEPEPAS